MTCGSVDDGKSTLTGRLLYDSEILFEDQLASLHADSARIGTQGAALDYALSPLPSRPVRCIGTSRFRRSVRTSGFICCGAS